MNNRICARDISRAVSALCRALREDEDFWNSWKANIAMAFQDEVKTHRGCGGIHQISNDAAERFLINLTREVDRD